MNDLSRDENGAVAVLVALMLVMFLGMGAIVVDAGALYLERRELQNGADAGALAVARDCARGRCGTPTATAASLADANADDGLATVDDVIVNTAARTATVETSTSDAKGGTEILHWFAGALGKDGSRVGAQATAQWGSPTTMPAVPLTISVCEWDRMVGSIASLPSATLTLFFHQGTLQTPCGGPAGQDTPGGFGWLDAASCTTRVQLRPGGVWVSAKPGNTPQGTSCAPASFAVGSTIIVPIFDAARGQGTGAEFRISGYAAFRVTGVNLQNSGGWVSGATCGSASTQCLIGQFVDYFEADGTLASASVPVYGVTTVALVG